MGVYYGVSQHFRWITDPGWTSLTGTHIPDEVGGIIMQAPLPFFLLAVSVPAVALFGTTGAIVGSFTLLSFVQGRMIWLMFLP